MSQARPLVDRTQAARLLKWQFFLALALMALALPAGRSAMLATGAGAGIALAGNAYFILRVFGGAGGNPQQVVRNFYRGEAGKLMITALLFAVVFAGFRTVPVPWLLTGFILELFVAWVVPLVASLRGER